MSSSSTVYRITNAWANRFLSDMGSHVSAENPLSTNQAQTCLRLIQRYRSLLVASGIDGSMVDSLLANPVYEQTPILSVDLPREIRYMGSNMLVLRSKFSAPMVDAIKKLKVKSQFNKNYPKWVAKNALWIIKVNGENWEAVMAFIKDFDVGFDDEVAAYFTNVANSVGKASEAKVDGDLITITARDDLMSAFLNTVAELSDV